MIDADDTPITLAEACGLFPRARLTISTLRAEAARGRLDIFRIGRRDYTTAAAMREMVNRCRAEDSRRDSISIRAGERGASGTEAASFALLRARESVQRLKSNSPNISPGNGNRSRLARR
jgi:hypothetical protein